MNTKKILKQMTTEDKARLLCGTTPNSIGGFESKVGSIPVLALQDGGTGINFMHVFGRGIIDMEIVQKGMDKISTSMGDMNADVQAVGESAQKINSIIDELLDAVFGRFCVGK